MCSLVIKTELTRHVIIIILLCCCCCDLSVLAHSNKLQVKRYWWSDDDWWKKKDNFKFPIPTYNSVFEYIISGKEWIHAYLMLQDQFLGLCKNSWKVFLWLWNLVVYQVRVKLNSFFEVRHQRDIKLLTFNPPPPHPHPPSFHHRLTLSLLDRDICCIWSFLASIFTVILHGITVAFWTRRCTSRRPWRCFPLIIPPPCFPTCALYTCTP